jgi:hypothetical protein
MLTVIGSLFLLSGGYCFLWAPNRLFGLLVISSLFEASSVVNIGGRGVQPYYLIATFFIARAMLYKIRNGGVNVTFNGRGLLIGFAVLGTVSAFVLPVVFAGMPVYDPSLGIDAGMVFRPPLELGLGNFAQAGYLGIQALVVWAAACSPSSLSVSRRAYTGAFYLLVAVISIQLICKELRVSFPYSVLQNNPGYYMEDTAIDLRLPGTFAEPSMAGVALSMFFAGFLAQFLCGKGKILRVLVAAAAVGIVASSGSLIAVGITTLALLTFPPKKESGTPPASVGPRRMAMIAVIAVAAAISPLRTTLMSQTVDKEYSNSFVKRAAADIYAVDLAASTNWVGVGLGSNRPSSLITALLSNLGVVGCIGFFLMFVRLLSNATGDSAWIRWSGVAIVVDMAIGVPDVTSSILWIVMALAVLSRNNSKLSMPIGRGAVQPLLAT